MRILVTGGAGFIGSNFVHYWVDRYPDDHVVVYDLLTYAGNRASLVDVEDRIVFVQGDICDRDLAEETLRAEQVEVVVNFAAESHNSLAVVDPARFFRTNVVGTQTFLDASRAAGVERFHHVSTCEVYGDLPLESSETFREDSPYRPRTPYNASKAGADHAVRAYFETFSLPITISNCSNNYGPYQFPEKLIPLMILNALDGKPLPVYGDGQNVRDWLYVEDHCRALTRVLEAGRVGETYCIGGDAERTNLQVVHAICAAVDALRPGLPHTPCGSLLTYVKDRPGHDRRYAMDTTKIRSELGWRPEVDFEAGLERTVRWYLDNPEWVERVGSGSYRRERLGLSLAATGV